MIRVEVRKNCISVIGHANFDDYGRDIVCAAVSSVVITSVEAIARFNDNVYVISGNDRLDIIIKKHDEISDKLIDNMLTCLTEIEKKYRKNLKISYKEE